MRYAMPWEYNGELELRIPCLISMSCEEEETGERVAWETGLMFKILATLLADAPGGPDGVQMVTLRLLFSQESACAASLYS